VLGVDTVVVMQHTKCGLTGVTDEELQQLTGAELGFLSIDDHEKALRDDIETLATTAYLGPLRTVAGFVFDVETGDITDVVRWERED
jgi:carbonic anhydrase